ncbi:hypothetical protein F5Y15DRAFT_234205 [Xylariaceae sp. FL0016]|nr:hypothetical protein F5Y15DRAFT_234205 [Xylariaceae sp. FL0016]
MPPAGITMVPLEILLEVGSYLGVADYGAMRLSCRQLERALFTAFAQAFFRQMHFMRTDFSLQALIDISKSRFAPFLKHVVIGTELLDPGLFHIPHSALHAPRRSAANRNINPEEVKYTIFNTMCANQAFLLNAGHDQQMLTEAFSNLDLEAVGIRAHPVYGPIAPETPMSYGTAKIRRETSIDLRSAASWSSRDDTRANAVCIYNILSALARSGSQPAKFETSLGGPGLGDDAFIIPQFIHSSVLPSMAKLKEVDLKVHGSSTRYRRIISPDTPSPHILETYNLRQFLSFLPNLERLRLKLVFNYDGFFEWLGSSRTREYKGQADFAPPSSPQFESLRELELTRCKMSTEHLIRIIRKFACSLQKLSLHDITLTSDKPQDNIGEELRESAWVTFISALARYGENLTEVRITSPLERLSVDERLLEFRDGVNTSREAKCVGTDLRKDLMALRDKIHPHRLEWESDELNSEESDHEQDDEEFLDQDIDAYDDYDYDDNYDDYWGIDDVYDDLHELEGHIQDELMMAALFH